MLPKTITAVVTDLDGTIIRRDGSVSPATRRVAQLLRARGIPLKAGIGPDAVTMSNAGDELLDITPAHTDKGTGLARAFERLGVDPHGAIAFGDAANDLPMFRAAGHAVAMANGTEEARAAADAVAGSVDDDGFAGYLDRLGELDLRRTSRL